MTIPLEELLARNRAWSEKERQADPEYFSRLVAQQNPEFLWIGCADSRVPANEIIGLAPGEVFVHRNVANVVAHTDLNCLSVMQYAVDVLKVKHIIITGHYRCGGVIAAMGNDEHGLIDNWLRNIKDIYYKYREQIEEISDQHERQDYLCELNVLEQVANVCYTTIVQNAWKRGQALSVHGWIYSLRDGLLRDLGITVSALDQIPDVYRSSRDIVSQYHAPQDSV